MIIQIRCIHLELSRYVKEQFYSGIPQFDDECGNLSVYIYVWTQRFVLICNGIILPFIILSMIRL